MCLKSICEIRYLDKKRYVRYVLCRADVGQNIPVNKSFQVDLCLAFLCHMQIQPLVFLHTKLIKLYLYGPSFAHSGTFMQKMAFPKLLSHGWTRTIVCLCTVCINPSLEIPELKFKRCSHTFGHMCMATESKAQ